MDVSKAIKHFCDRISGFVLLVASAPLLLVCCVAIRLEGRGNPIVLEERVGARGRAFSMFRFRVTRSTEGPRDEGAKHTGSDRGANGSRERVADERTNMGRLLGRTRCEWLPLLINIVLGEMSFVGPLPARRGEAERYSPRQARRLMFRPGVTGWAQVHSTHTRITAQQRLDLDLTYCERFSLGLDLRILWHAVWRTRPGLRAEERRQTVPESPGLVTAGDPRHESPAKKAGQGAAEAAAPGVSAHAGARALVPVLVVGTGGHARVVLDAIERQGQYQVIGLLADTALRGQEFFGARVLGGAEVLERADTPRRVVVALGSGRARETWFATLEKHDYDIVPIVHPDAHVGRDVEIGAGAVVLAGAVVNPGVRLGRGVLVRSGSTLDHGCNLDDFTQVAPGAHLASDVHVGARSHVGIGACVVPGIRLGSDVLVGAGAVVTQSVPRGYTVVGTPGRTMRRPDLGAGRGANRAASRAT